MGVQITRVDRRVAPVIRIHGDDTLFAARNVVTDANGGTCLFSQRLYDFSALQNGKILQDLAARTVGEGTHTLPMMPPILLLFTKNLRINREPVATGSSSPLHRLENRLSGWSDLVRGLAVSS